MALLKKPCLGLGLEGNSLPNYGDFQKSRIPRQCFKKPAAVGLHGFKPHPPHHIRSVKFAQISLILSVEQQKNDFKLWAGDTDILASPKLNGTNLGWIVVIESKKNDSGWNRSFLQEVRKHMKMRAERLGMLTVEVMPRGANGFMIEPCSEGVILVTSRDNFKVAYGALRAVLIALHPSTLNR